MRLKIVLTMLVLALLACSVPGAADVENIANEAATAAVEEIEEQVEEQTGSGEEPSPEPTEETEAPTAEPTAEPETSEDAATPEPTAEESTSEDDSAPDAAAFPGADNNCSHPYFPVVDGATWTYESGLQGEAPEEYVVTHREVTESSFEFVQVYEGGEFNITWQCTDEGLIQTTYATASVGDEALQIDLETISVDGITFPEEFVPGATWTTSYETVADVTGSDSQLDFDVTINYTYVQDEEVTVPAGTFTAARVEQTITIASTAVGTEQAVEAVSWYVEGIGLVRNESEFAGFASYYELASYEFPE